MGIDVSVLDTSEAIVSSTIGQSGSDLTDLADEDFWANVSPRRSQSPTFAGASPAVPRDPRVLEAEAADLAARRAAEEADAAQLAAQAAVARAAEARAAADRSRADLAAAHDAARAKAEAAAEQIKQEQQQAADAAAAARAEKRARRDERLGARTTVPEVEPRVVTVTKRSTDAFPGALGLFLLRLVLAGWAGIVGWQSLTDRAAVVDALVKVGLPQPAAGPMSWLVGVGLIGFACLLLFGVGTRVFAAVLFAGTIGFLAFFRFGPFSPFLEGHFGFYGDRDVLVAVTSLLLVLVGGGGWSLDAGVRRRRAASREAATVE